MLDNATFTVQSYKTIVDGHDADNIMSEHKKENIRMRARYPTQAYCNTIEEMPFKTWNDWLCTHSMVAKIQWEPSGKTRVFCISCQTTRTLRHKRQCSKSKPGSWGYCWIERRNVIANLQVKGSSTLGDAPRIATDVNL